MVQSVLATRATPAWAQPYFDYLSHDTLPEDEVEARQIQRRSKSFTIINQELYWQSVTGVLQCCIDSDKGKELLKDIHQGECGHHASARAIADKAFRHGHYWPTANTDAEDLVRRCKACQYFAKQSHLPVSALRTIPSPGPS